MVKPIVSPTPGSHLQPLAATPVVASGRHPSLLIGSHLHPLAANRVAASGHQNFLLIGSHLQPVAASVRQRQSSGRKWPPVATSIWFFIGSHLQPLEWPPVAASGRPHSLFIGNHLQPLAANRVAASGRQSKWPQVAARASGRKWPPLPKSNSCPSARSL